MPLTTNALLFVTGVPGDMTITLSVELKFSLAEFVDVHGVGGPELGRWFHFVQVSFLATLIAFMTR